MDISKTKQWKCVGGLSKPGKMPCYAYSISAFRCILGSKLAMIKGSVCENCYARHGRYPMKNVQDALERRFASLNDPDWVDNMTFLIKNAGQGYFRWHDSGDLQGVWHLNNIVEIAKRCPETKFWLPTKELKIISEWSKAHGLFPDNLCVRISATMKDTQLFPSSIYPTSMVVTNVNNKIKQRNYVPYVLCPSFQNKGKCGTCRACWDKSVDCVAYREH